MSQSSAARKHYHDIDGARSVLMFLSVALHAGTVYAPARPWITSNIARHDFFDWVIFGLHLFITPTFFFVGGFFTVLLLKRRSVGDFLWNRFLRTAIPLITIALSFNMIEHYLRYRDAGGLAGPLEWPLTQQFADIWVSGEWQLHLWFLVSLIPMFILSAVINWIMPANLPVRSLIKQLAGKLGEFVGKTGVFAIFLLGLAAFNVLNFAAASAIPGSYDLIVPGFQSWYKLISEFPFFILGVLTALSPVLLQSICKWRSWMPYAAAAAFFFQPYAFPDQGPVMGMVMLFLNQLVMWTIVLFILQFFHRYFNVGGAKVSWFADCALSMYLFHHCFIYIYGRFLVPLDWPIWMEFLMLTVMAAATVIVIHEFLVRRYVIFRLLFNGKTELPAVKMQPATSQPGS